MLHPGFKFAYSITSSARTRKVSGIASPTAWAIVHSQKNYHTWPLLAPVTIAQREVMP
jgi:hypothetical protein